MPSAQQPLLPEGDNQLFDIIQAILAVLKDKDIPVCVVGEIALNYYNVPRIVHVRPSDLRCKPLCPLTLNVGCRALRTRS